MNLFAERINAFPLCVGFILLFVLSTSPIAYAQKNQIAVINMQKVLRNSKAGKKAMAELNKKFEKLKRQLQAKQKELKAFKQEMEKKAPLMNEEARAEKERQYKKMLREFKDKSDDAQYEMRQAESKRMEPILKQLEKIVTKIGKEKHFVVIMEKNMPGIYYTAPDADITDLVIKVFDRSK